jgi:hypothetical protein
MEQMLYTVAYIGSDGAVFLLGSRGLNFCCLIPLKLSV